MSAFSEIQSLVPAIRSGSIRAIARGLSWIEAGGDRAEALSERLYQYTKGSSILGITGAPGAGKSTLVAALIKEIRSRSFTVGVLAVDPSSPFSGGAILGDRIRMNDVSGDEGVFIRSMATRGVLGGLCRAAADGVDLLCASGKDFVIVETVGVGQDEIDIMRLAHTTVVVSVPGLGDEVQALKAGIIEIADIHVVNKADREGASQTIAELQSLLAMKTAGRNGWNPPVLASIATEGVGMSQLLDLIEGHRMFLRTSGEMDRQLRIIAEARVLNIAQHLLAQRFGDSKTGSEGFLRKQIERVVVRELSPHRCAREVFDRTQYKTEQETRLSSNV
jgi:LAO/AO transport system kinase